MKHKVFFLLLMLLPVYTATSAKSFDLCKKSISEESNGNGYIGKTNAAAYNKQKSDEGLIREDRIWTYEDQVYRHEPGKMGRFNLKFDGTSVFEDKEYHNVYIWRPDKEYSKENAILIGYMREEGDKVYVYNDWDGLFKTLVKHDLYDKEDDFKFLLNGPTTQRDKYGTTEYLIYDFSLTPEDPMPVKTPFMSLEDNWTVTYDGEEYNYQYFISDFFPLLSLGVYEKTGAAYGFLPYPGTGSDISLSMNMDFWALCTVSNLDGDILFDADKVTTATDRIETDSATVVSERHYNVQGQEVKPDTPGIVICVRVMSDGSTRTVKKINR